MLTFGVVWRNALHDQLCSELIYDVMVMPSSLLSVTVWLAITEHNLPSCLRHVMGCRIDIFWIRYAAFSEKIDHV